MAENRPLLEKHFQKGEKTMARKKPEEKGRLARGWKFDPKIIVRIELLAKILNLRAEDVMNSVIGHAFTDIEVRDYIAGDGIHYTIECLTPEEYPKIIG